MQSIIEYILGAIIGGVLAAFTIYFLIPQFGTFLGTGLGIFILVLWLLWGHKCRKENLL